MKRLSNPLLIFNLASLRYVFATIFVFVSCLTQLSGCGVTKQSAYSGCDGPPSVEVDTSRLRNAVPKVEPYHPYGTKNYVLKGRRYKVLKSSKGYVKRGYASWYGSKFHGRETATQERFNLYGMTAASKELPLPSYVQVTNLHNGKKIVVRVNDRGPFHSKRIIDLSYAAAKKLGFAEKGVAPVKVVAIDPKAWHKNKKRKVRKASYRKVTKKPASTPKKQQKSPQIFLQLGAFSKFDNAKRLSTKANKIIKDKIQIKQKSDLYHVHIGPLASSAQRDELKGFLEQHGFDKIALVEE